MSTSSRRGFTLVELLIVIAIIGLLMGLLLPAIQGGRERSRMATCNNNQRQVALAIFDKGISGGKSSFPSWAEYMKIDSAGNPGDRAIPWPVKLLPRLDNQTLWEQIRTANGGAGFGAPPALGVFACPSNPSTNPNLGLLSYVINAGLPDPVVALTGNQVSDVKANGVAHDQRPGRNGPSVRAGADMPDGASTTLLLTENIHRDETTWLGPVQAVDAGNAGTLTVDMEKNPEQRFGFMWVYESATAPGQPDPNTQAPINRDWDEPPQYYSDPSLRHTFARPASTHPEVVIVAFADASTSEIAETIDYAVYQQLMTPNGLKAEIPNQSPPVFLEKPGRTFMQKPLNDGDY